MADDGGGSVNISGQNVNIQGNVAGRDITGNNTINASMSIVTQQLAEWRKGMDAAIEKQPVSEDDKKDMKETVAKIEAEVKKIDEQKTKGEEPDPSRLEKIVNTLAIMGPDIFEVAMTTLTNPLAGVGLVIKKINEKAKLEKAGK